MFVLGNHCRVGRGGRGSFESCGFCALENHYWNLLVFKNSGLFIFMRFSTQFLACSQNSAHAIYVSNPVLYHVETLCRKGVFVWLVMSCCACVCFVLFFPVSFSSQHSHHWRGWLPHVGPVWLGECFLCVWSPLTPVGLLHVEISAQRRRQGRLLQCRQYICGVTARPYLAAAHLYNWSQCPHVYPWACVRLCLQGLSSPWSPWEVVGPSPNCPKDIGCGCSNNPQSGEIKIKEVCMCVCAFHTLCTFFFLEQSCLFGLSIRLTSSCHFARKFYCHPRGCITATS